MNKTLSSLYRKNSFRFTALFLSLSLSVPNSALAMRQTGLEESDKVKGIVVSRLRGNPEELRYSTGLEERKRVPGWAKATAFILSGAAAGVIGLTAYNKMAAPVAQPPAQVAPEVPAAPRPATPQVSPATPAPQPPAPVSIQQFSVVGNVAEELTEQRVRLKLVIPDAWKGKRKDLVAAIFRKTDTYYLQKKDRQTSAFQDIGPNGEVTLESDRPLKGAAPVVVVLERKEIEDFVKMYDEGRAQGAARTAAKYALVVIAVDEAGAKGIEGWQGVPKINLLAPPVMQMPPQPKQEPKQKPAVATLGTPKQILADVAQRLEPSGMIIPVLWGNSAELLEIPDFFDNVAEAKMKAVFIPSNFAEMSLQDQQTVIDRVKKAKVPVLGFMFGSPDWVLETERPNVRRRLNQLFQALLRLDLGKELRVVIVFDVEPHIKAYRAKTKWNGDLQGYSALLREVVELVAEFSRTASQRHGRSILYEPSVATFEPHWWVNDRETSDGFVIRNLAYPPGIAVIGMTYQPDAESILNTAGRVWTRVLAAKNVKFSFGLETKPEEGTPNFSKRLGEVPMTLRKMSEGVPESARSELFGLFIHSGSDGKDSGIQRGDRMIRGWLGKPVAPSAPAPSAKPAGTFGVEGDRVKFSPMVVQGKLVLPNEWKGKQSSLRVALLGKTDTWYLKQEGRGISPFRAIGPDGTVVLKADRPIAGPAVLVVVKAEDAAGFTQLYDEGRRQGSYKAVEKYAQAIILVHPGGKTEVVDELPRGGLEEIPMAVANRIFKDPEVGGALEVSGRAVLDSEQVKALGFQAALALLIREEAHAVEGNHVIFADQRLKNLVAEKLLPWLKVGTTAEEVVAKAKELHARVGDLMVLQMDQGLSREIVEKLMVAYFPEAVDQVRVVVGDQAQVGGLSVFAFQLLATEKGLPSVVVLSVVVRLKDEQGTAYTLVLMA